MRDSLQLKRGCKAVNIPQLLADFEEDPQFIVIRNMKIAKRKKGAKRKRKALRDEVPLPRSGPLGKFTRLVEEHLKLVDKPESKLFKFGRHRAYQIVSHITGKWCHYFRSEGESWYGKQKKEGTVWF